MTYLLYICLIYFCNFYNWIHFVNFENNWSAWNLMHEIPHYLNSLFCVFIRYVCSKWLIFFFYPLDHFINDFMSFFPHILSKRLHIRCLSGTWSPIFRCIKIVCEDWTFTTSVIISFTYNMPVWSHSDKYCELGFHMCLLLYVPGLFTILQ